MLVRECFSEVARDAEGNIIRDSDGNPVCVSGERWIEVPDVQTEADASTQQAQEAAAAAVLATNERTIGQQLDAALMANQQAITALAAWRTTGPGAGTTTLTTAQLSAAMRTAADNQIAANRQLNGLIRLVRRNLSTADLNQGVSKPAAPLS